MKTAIGSTFMYNLIIIFILIVFAFLGGIMSYYKAFKINNRIVYAIEKFEGYNTESIKEIELVLGNFGYDRDVSNFTCDERDDMTLVTETAPNFRYCIYVDEGYKSGDYYSYGVKTYMSIDLPVIKLLKLPIYTKTNQIYKFTRVKQEIY